MSHLKNQDVGQCWLDAESYVFYARKRKKTLRVCAER